MPMQMVTLLIQNGRCAHRQPYLLHRDGRPVFHRLSGVAARRAKVVRQRVACLCPALAALSISAGGAARVLVEMISCGQVVHQIIGPRWAVGNTCGVFTPVGKMSISDFAN